MKEAGNKGGKALCRKLHLQKQFISISKSLRFSRCFFVMH